MKNAKSTCQHPMRVIATQRTWHVTATQPTWQFVATQRTQRVFATHRARRNLQSSQCSKDGWVVSISVQVC